MRSRLPAKHFERSRAIFFTHRLLKVGKLGHLFRGNIEIRSLTSARDVCKHQRYLGMFDVKSREKVARELYIFKNLIIRVY